MTCRYPRRCDLGELVPQRGPVYARRRDCRLAQASLRSPAAPWKDRRLSGFSLAGTRASSLAAAAAETAPRSARPDGSRSPPSGTSAINSTCPVDGSARQLFGSSLRRGVIRGDDRKRDQRAVVAGHGAMLKHPASSRPSTAPPPAAGADSASGRRPRRPSGRGAARPGSGRLRRGSPARSLRTSWKPPCRPCSRLPSRVLPTPLSHVFPARAFAP